jgi:endonuclease/exonuclease/phosphatase family metal-dependent hydrolase
MRKYILQISIFLLSSIIALPLILIGLLQITDYNPPNEEVFFSGEVGDTLMIGKQQTLITWNIGYAGLGDDMDFFYDGGTKVRTSLSRTRQNLDSIKQWLKETPAEFVVLQEVDFNSKRTYYMNQHERILKELSATINSVQAYNYKVRYLPFPPTKPLGRIESGLVSISSYKPEECVRYSFQAKFPWPKKLWMLDRAYLVQKFPTSNGKALYIINTHNTAFDDGTIRQKETEQISDYAVNLYNNGNYVVIAGDWNQTPTTPATAQKESKQYFIVQTLNTSLFPSEWTIAHDPNIHTNRSLNTSDPKLWETFTLDYAICSPNITITKTETQPFGFKFSDHNPVKISFFLKNQ